MTAGRTKAELLRENRQLRQRIAALECQEGKAGGERSQVPAALCIAGMTLESSNDAIVSTSPDGIVLNWNRAAEKLFGYTASQAIGREYRDLVVPAGGRKRMARKLASLRRGRHDGHEEVVLRRQDGSTVAVSELATPVMDLTGRVVGTSINLRDISMHKANEANLRMFRSLLDMSGDAIEVVDPENHRFIEVNETACRALGYSREELLTMRVPDVNPEMDEAALAQMDRRLRKQRTVLVESMHRRKDGSVFPIEVSISAVRLDRKYYVVSARDISERRQEEARHRAIFEGMLDGVGIIDLTSQRFVDANQAMCRMLGYSREELVRRHVPAIHFKKDWPSVSEQFALQAAGKLKLIEAVPMKRKDGSRFHADISTSIVDMGGKPYMVGVVRDISARKQAEERMNLFRSLIDHSSDAIEVMDLSTLEIVDVNETECRMLGYSREELLGKLVTDIDTQQDEASGKRISSEVRKRGNLLVESVHRRKDGSTFPVEVSMTYAVFDRPYLLAIVRDISERKQAEAALRESEQAYRALAQNLPGMVYRLFVREGARMVFYNDAVQEITGYAADALTMGKICSIEPLILDEDRPRVVATVRQAIAEKGAFSVEYRLRRRRGDIRWMSEHGMPVYGEDGVPLYIEGVIFDVTDRKRDEDRLRLFRSLIDHSNDGIEVLEPGTFRFLDVNETSCRALGYSREELLGMSVSDIDPPFDQEAARRLIRQLKKEGNARFEGVHRRKDGSTFPVDLSSALIRLDRSYVLTIARDATERKRSEGALRLANRSLSMLSELNLALVKATSEPAFLKRVSQIIVDVGGYNLATVDYAEHDPEKTITPMAWSGSKRRRYWAKAMTWADTEAGQIPAAWAIRSGTVQCCPDIATADVSEAWRESALSHGYAANFAFPLTHVGGVFGALSIYAPEAGVCDETEILILQGLADALAYGIDVLRTRSEHEQHTTILQHALEQSIQTISETLAARDPYTAGHQQKVSRLAVAIAQEMGLPEDRVHGIHLAAIIHDLGKIRIPAEILSKPGKLNDLEYMLIKTHPQAGYDILKDVKFPWPIAEIVLQHHERMDGSGYPRGLKGDAILLEARVIAVADLIDAMSSHRPYRPARGIKAAMAELKRTRGKLYDTDVVDACLQLHRTGRLPG